MILVLIIVTLLRLSSASTTGSIFVKQGKVYQAVTFGHIDIPIDLEPLSKRIYEFRQLNQQVQQTALPSNHSAVEQRFWGVFQDWVNQTTETLDGRHRILLQALELPANDTAKSKRQLLVAGVGAIIGSFLTTIVRGFQDNTLIQVIQNKQEVLSSRVQANMVLINQQQEDIQRLRNATRDLGYEMGRVVLGLNRLEWRTLMLNTQFSIDYASK